MPTEIGTWTRQALNAGGKLTVQSLIPGKSVFFARMSWPGEYPIQGELAMSPEDALKKLETVLCSDAVDKTTEKGRA